MSKFTVNVLHKILSFLLKLVFSASLLLEASPTLYPIKVLFECRRNAGFYVDEKINRLFWAARYDGNAIYTG